MLFQTKIFLRAMNAGGFHTQIVQIQVFINGLLWLY